VDNQESYPQLIEESYITKKVSEVSPNSLHLKKLLCLILRFKQLHFKCWVYEIMHLINEKNDHHLHDSLCYCLVNEKKALKEGALGGEHLHQMKLLEADSNSKISGFTRLSTRNFRVINLAPKILIHGWTIPEEILLDDGFNFETEITLLAITLKVDNFKIHKTSEEISVIWADDCWNFVLITLKLEIFAF